MFGCNIEYLGRTDNQVNINELAEIESLLNSHPVIQECIVIARDEI